MKQISNLLVLFRALSASKDTAKFYLYNPDQENSKKSQAVSIGRNAFLHFVPLDGLGTGDGLVAILSNASKFFLMGKAIQKLEGLISQEDDFTKYTPPFLSSSLV